MRACALTIIFVFLAVACYGDVVFFTSPDQFPIEGKVTETREKVIVELPDGTKKEFAKDDIREVAYGKTLKGLLKEKRAEIDKSNLSKQFDLAMWCEKVGLEDDKSLILIEILTVDPENEKVHLYLGHVKKGDRWVAARASEEFGDDIVNNLTAGVISTYPGKNFVLKTDTSKEFAEYALSYLDRFTDVVENKFKGVLNFKSKQRLPIIVVYSSYDLYTAHFRKSIDKILPNSMLDGDRPRGPLSPHVDKEYTPPAHTCFFDPVTFEGVTYKYKTTKGIVPLKENIQKCAAFGMYKYWLGGMKSIYKSPMFMIEGFSQLLAFSYIENSELVFDDDSETIREYVDLVGENINVGTLFKIDPLSYYVKDCKAHRAASWAYARYSQVPEGRYSKCYSKVVAKDRAGSLKTEAFKGIYKNTKKMFYKLSNYIHGL